MTSLIRVECETSWLHASPRGIPCLAYANMDPFVRATRGGSFRSDNIKQAYIKYKVVTLFKRKQMVTDIVHELGSYSSFMFSILLFEKNSYILLFQHLLCMVLLRG